MNVLKAIGYFLVGCIISSLTIGIIVGLAIGLLMLLGWMWNTMGAYSLLFIVLFPVVPMMHGLGKDFINGFFYPMLKEIFFNEKV